MRTRLHQTTTISAFGALLDLGFTTPGKFVKKMAYATMPARRSLRCPVEPSGSSKHTRFGDPNTNLIRLTCWEDATRDPEMAKYPHNVDIVVKKKMREATQAGVSALLLFSLQAARARVERACDSFRHPDPKAR